MSRQDETGQLMDSLQTLEKNLETPVVPGELSAWMRYLRQSVNNVEHVLRHAIENRHEECLRGIAADDPGLLPRVEQLRSEQAGLQQDIEAVASRLSRFEGQSSDDLANQPDLDEQIADIVELGIRFVIRTRTFETALATWRMESIDRDRGVAD